MKEESLKKIHYPVKRKETGTAVRVFIEQHGEQYDEEPPVGSGEGGIFAYVRRSSEDRKGRPLKTQFETITDYVTKYSRDITDREKSLGIRKFYIDNGISGSTRYVLRHGLSELLNDMDAYSKSLIGKDRIGEGKIHFIVYDVSRLARDASVGSEIKALIENQHGGVIHLASQGLCIKDSTTDMLFNMSLSAAASERTATMLRVRTAFRHNSHWDPRKSFGWKYEGSGQTPTELEDEQEILKEIHELYSKQGLTLSEIVQIISAKYGPRRWRGIHDLDSSKEDPPKTIAWSTPDISFLARKHGWRWGGPFTHLDLEEHIYFSKRREETFEEFLKKYKGVLCDGVKITKVVLSPYYMTTLPKWKALAHAKVKQWIQKDDKSVDNVVDLLNEQVPRPDGFGWTRQTTWRIMKKMQHEIKREHEFEMAIRDNKNVVPSFDPPQSTSTKMPNPAIKKKVGRPSKQKVEE